MDCSPGRENWSVSRRWMGGGFPHPVRGLHGTPTGILHQEGKAEGYEADQGADIERLVHAEDKHLSHRVENDGELIPLSGRDDRRNRLHPSFPYQLGDLVTNGVVPNGE